MVRAGEHALASMIEAALAPEFEIIDNPLAGSRPYRLFRTNDAASDHPVKMSNTKLIVLTREPRGQMLASAARMRKLQGARFPEKNADHMEYWLARSALQYRDFTTKWCGAGLPFGTVALDHAELLSDTTATLGKAVAAFGVRVSEDQLGACAEGNIQPPETQPRIADTLIDDYLAAIANPDGNGRIARIAKILASTDGASTPSPALRDEAELIGNPGLLKVFA